jgi:hypothetical protein
MSSWLARMFKGAEPKPGSVNEIRPLSPEKMTQLKRRIGEMSVEDLTRELETFGYKVVGKHGHHLVSHARFGRIERHAYEQSDLATILRKEIAEQERAR